MDAEKQRNLLIEEYKAFLSIIDSKGVVFTPPYSEDDLPKLSTSDLKRLVAIARDVSRTPSGGQ